MIGFKEHIRKENSPQFASSVLYRSVSGCKQKNN